MNNQSYHYFKKGFTLTELIVTLVVSGIFLVIFGQVVYTGAKIFDQRNTSGKRIEEVQLIFTRCREFINSANLVGDKISCDGISLSTLQDSISFENNIITYDSKTSITLTKIKTINFQIEDKDVIITIICDNDTSYQRTYYSLYSINNTTPTES